MTRKQTLRIGVYGCLGLIVLLLLLHPFSRQTLFGPKVQDMPLCYWQDNFRRYGERATPRDSLVTKVLRWLGFDQVQQPWLPESWDDRLAVLASLVDDDDPKVRHIVALSLSERYSPERGLDPEPGVPPLLRLLDDAEAKVRGTAALSLSKFRPEPAEALPRLREMLDDPDPFCRVQAAWAVWHVGKKKHPEVVRTLGQAIKDMSYPSRLVALDYLGMLDTDITGASADIVACATKDPNDAVRLFAAALLDRIGPAAVPVLVGTLRDADWDTRNNAARALGRLGPAAKDAVPDLRGLLTDNSPTVRKSAAAALKHIDPANETRP